MRTSIFGALARVVGAALMTLSLCLAACVSKIGSDPDITVTSVTVSTAGGATSVNQGETLQFSAVVDGKNNPPQTVAWSIATTGISGDTTISTSGLLTVAGDETATSLTIEAKSTFDAAKNGFATVTVNNISLDDLSGNISISPAGPVTTGTTLTATYSGNESVAWQWHKDGIAINRDGYVINSASTATYTPYEPGSYTVLVSAAGHNGKLSDPVTVTGNVIPPEAWPVADRWSKWVDVTSNTTLNYSVASDGVCTITVGGTAVPANWKTHAAYTHTAIVNTPYEYKFEAWTEPCSGNRPIQIQYYYPSPTDPEEYLHFFETLTENRKTYTLKGQRIPKGGGVQDLKFQCADQTGTFYVKVLSITEYTPVLEYELIDENDEYGFPNPNNGTYRLISTVGMGGAVEIPATYNGLSVTEIGDSAFWNNKSITGVNIPESVKTIGWGAFAECSSLTDITIPANVTKIKSSAFAGCSKLTSITVANDNQYYSSTGGVLYNSGKTTLVAVPGGKSGSIVILPSVTEIGDSAFEGCRSLTSITIPSSVQRIEEEAFRNCTSITSITIPATVQYIGWWAFDGWTSSQTIYIAGHDNRPSTIDAGWEYYSEWYEGEYYNFAWDSNCNANIIYQANQLIIQGIPLSLMMEFINAGDADGWIGLFPPTTTLQQAWQMSEDYWNTGNPGSVVAGQELSEAYTNDDLTTGYIPLYNVQTGFPWKDSGSYMIGILVESNSYPYSRKMYWFGPVNFSSRNTTVTFNPGWEVTLP